MLPELIWLTKMCFVEFLSLVTAHAFHPAVPLP